MTVLFSATSPPREVKEERRYCIYECESRMPVSGDSRTENVAWMLGSRVRARESGINSVGTEMRRVWAWRSSSSLIREVSDGNYRRQFS